jgi:hypothetical protein
MNRRYRIEDAAVVSEIIDGEAIMMHQVSGDYFSADGLGCLIWQWIGEGRSRRQMLDFLEARSGRPSAEISQALDSFIADLLTHALIREAEDDEGSAAMAQPEPPTNGRGEYAPPILNVYTDMRDLLLLDPIHDVEEEAGWPVPKRTGAKP